MGMKINFKAVGLCVAIALSFAPSVFAGRYIIGKEEDETLLSLSIAFLVICSLFLLVSIVATLMMFRRTRVSWGSMDYALEDLDVRYESMYSGKQNGENMPAQYEQLKLSEPSNGFYQSLDNTKERGKQNNNKDKQGKENGQEDASETELKNRPLSSFQNSAYQSTSMNSGLDVAKDCETPM
ncbi:uncharacterized protein LOC110044057 [Orbicella faveolata]|uniref:uncharacterized protein LOC110044057 n=1 Tax=Orbicella faveolata TaxID=48498 RepID=UPI0009E6525C|nr:uncharacterized protein LOC110044057 [Orbicella faveolata]